VRSDSQRFWHRLPDRSIRSNRQQRRIRFTDVKPDFYDIEVIEDFLTAAA
jgi:hypothetical protein